MNKKSLYLLLHLLTTVVANWITIEHELDLCGMTIPGNYTAFHVNDEDWTAYSTSFMFISAENLKNDTSSATFNLTMWGCKFDCSFSFVIQLNKADSSVSVLTNKTVDNYSCLTSNYTQNVIPTVNVTHNHPKPNDQYIFSPLVTLDYCSRGLHPDFPGSEIDPAFDVHTCIDRLTANYDGTYAANLHFGKGSSFSPDGWDVATYHLINSANTAFEYWDTHHQALHDAFGDLSSKMTPDNFKSLEVPPKPDNNDHVVGAVIGVAVCFIPFAGCFRAAKPLLELVGEDGLLVRTVAVRFEELSRDLEAAIARDAEESVINRINGEIDALIKRGRPYIDRLRDRWGMIPNRRSTRDIIKRIAKFYEDENVKAIIKRLDTAAGTGSRLSPIPEHPEPPEQRSTREIIKNIAKFYENDNLNVITKRSNAASSRPPRLPPLPPRPLHERDTDEGDNLGAYSVALVNDYFVSTAMKKLDESLNFTDFSDLATYLSGTSERLLFHFNETLYDNFFTANKSIIHTFAGTQVVSNNEIIADADGLYNSVRSVSYNSMSATFLSTVLNKLKLVICDPAPSFCGKGCYCGRGGCGGTWHCPRIGKDGCVTNIVSYQLDELNSLRDSSDICSNNGTGWDMTHNPSCSTKLFECQNESGEVLIPIGG